MLISKEISTDCFQSWKRCCHNYTLTHVKTFLLGLFLISHQSHVAIENQKTCRNNKVNFLSVLNVCVFIYRACKKDGWAITVVQGLSSQIGTCYFLMNLKKKEKLISLGWFGLSLLCINNIVIWSFWYTDNKVFFFSNLPALIFRYSEICKMFNHAVINATFFWYFIIIFFWQKRKDYNFKISC